MLEVYGNLWDYPADVKVITTNGFVKTNGECVMGRGCAREAAVRWPNLPRMVGNWIKEHGNIPGCFIPGLMQHDMTYIWTMPVKHNWWEEADLNLIQTSARMLVNAANLNDQWKTGFTVVMPRPGSGNGRLDWETSVKPAIKDILDDRFHVITFAQ